MHKYDFDNCEKEYTFNKAEPAVQSYAAGIGGKGPGAFQGLRGLGEWGWRGRGCLSRAKESIELNDGRRRRRRRRRRKMVVPRAAAA